MPALIYIYIDRTGHWICILTATTPQLGNLLICPKLLPGLYTSPELIVSISTPACGYVDTPNSAFEPEFLKECLTRSFNREKTPS
jgi:hypothetical protein